MVKIIDKGGNPLIVMEPEDVLAWLREKADGAGYADRQGCMVQVSVTQPFAADKTYHGECPTLTYMVSNIPATREPK